MSEPQCLQLVTSDRKAGVGGRTSPSTMRTCTVAVDQLALSICVGDEIFPSFMFEYAMLERISMPTTLHKMRSTDSRARTLYINFESLPHENRKDINTACCAALSSSLSACFKLSSHFPKSSLRYFTIKRGNSPSSISSYKVSSK